MMRVIILALVSCSVVVVAGQNPSEPGFDVVSIKRNTSNAFAFNVSITRSQAVFRNVTLRALLYRAYDINADTPIVGLPSWVDREHYDITARSAASPSVSEQRPMWRAVLADRVKLIAHMETREQALFNLVIARADGTLGPGLTPSTLSCPETLATPADIVAVVRRGPALVAAMPRTAASDAKNTPQTPEIAAERLKNCGPSSEGNSLVSGSMTMGALAQYLTGRVERNVVDKTALAGSYAIRMVAENNENGGSMFTALREQLGLKLEPVRAQAQVLVIDHIERPTEN
jgi:uncharacterized protein (TIGR03435 family)